MALLVGRHLGRECAHRIGARIGRDIAVEGLRAALERERHGERLGGVARGAPGLQAVRAEMPFELPAGELGKLAPGSTHLDELVLLALLASELLELVGQLALAAAAQEALELGITPRRLALEQQRVREQLRQIPWQQARAHVHAPQLQCTERTLRTAAAAPRRL